MRELTELGKHLGPEPRPEVVLLKGLLKADRAKPTFLLRFGSGACSLVNTLLHDLQLLFSASNQIWLSNAVKVSTGLYSTLPHASPYWYLCTGATMLLFLSNCSLHNHITRPEFPQAYLQTRTGPTCSCSPKFKNFLGFR